MKYFPSSVVFACHKKLLPCCWVIQVLLIWLNSLLFGVLVTHCANSSGNQSYWILIRMMESLAFHWNVVLMPEFEWNSSSRVDNAGHLFSDNDFVLYWNRMHVDTDVEKRKHIWDKQITIRHVKSYPLFNIFSNHHRNMCSIETKCACLNMLHNLHDALEKSETHYQVMNSFVGNYPSYSWSR